MLPAGSRPATGGGADKNYSLQQPRDSSGLQLSSDSMEAPPQALSTNTATESHDVEDHQETEAFDSKCRRWQKPEVQALIHLRSAMNPIFQETGPQGPLWEEISTGMACLGYSRNAERCKEKWESTDRNFRKMKETDKKSLDSTKTCPYFHQLDLLYQKGILGNPIGKHSKLDETSDNLMDHQNSRADTEQDHEAQQGEAANDKCRSRGTSEESQFKRDAQEDAVTEDEETDWYAKCKAQSDVAAAELLKEIMTKTKVTLQGTDSGPEPKKEESQFKGDVQQNKPMEDEGRARYTECGTECVHIKGREGCDSCRFTLGDGKENQAEVASDKSRSRSTNEELQFRPKAQYLGLKSWDDKYDPGSTLVLADVTSSDEQLDFVFFHTKAMMRLFRCGLPYSKVTILLEKQLIWVQEMMVEPWRALWLGSDQGCLRPFLVNEESISQENDNAEFQERESLSKIKALSEFGISVNGPQSQEFVEPHRSETGSLQQNIHGEPIWISWVTSVINHVFHKGKSRQRARVLKKLTVSSGKCSPGTKVSLNGDKVPVDQNAQEASPRLQHEGNGIQERRSLVVLISFSRPALPFFEYSDDRDSAKEITGEQSALPTRISKIQPQLTVEFYRESEEKCVTTTLEVKYQMNCQGKWPGGWFQNDLRLAFRSNNEEGEQAQTHSEVAGKKTIETNTVRNDGGSRSDQHGVSGNGGASGSVYFLSLNGNVSGQTGSTAQTSWSTQSNYISTIDVLGAHPFFGVSSHSSQTKMEFEASFWPAHDPSMLYYREPWHKFERSGLRSDMVVKASADWELSGNQEHEYVFEASKELSSCTKGGQENGAQSRKKFKLFSGEASTASSTLQHQNGDEVTQERVLQIFRNKFLLNHNFAEFFSRYKKSGAYRWRVVDKPSPVPKALRE